MDNLFTEFNRLAAYIISPTLFLSTSPASEQITHVRRSLISSWLYEIYRGNIIGTVFLDLVKAFDIVNHDIFLQKRKVSGCTDRGIMLKPVSRAVLLINTTSFLHQRFVHFFIHLFIHWRFLRTHEYPLNTA